MPLKVVFDSGSGLDQLDGSPLVTVTDSASGSDSASQNTLVSITDSASGVDSTNLIGGGNSTISVSDTADGTDDIAITVSFGLADTLGMGENVGGATSVTIISISDSGSGTDTTTIRVSLGISDVATGDDTNLNLPPESKSISDDGAGTDSLNLSILKTISDSGSGNDNLSSTPAGVPGPSSPNTIPATVLASTLPAYVELFEIDCSAIPGIGVIYYATPNVNSNNTKVIFGNNTYEPYPIQITGFEQTSDEAPPRPTLSIANINLLFGMLAFTFQDIIGAKVIYYRTFAQYLGGAGKISAPPLKFYIGKKLSHTIQGISWELRSPLDKERSYLPKRQMLKKDFPGLGINKAIG